MTAEKPTFIIVVQESDGPRFWVAGRKWSAEYPDAGLFHNKRDAVATAWLRNHR